MYLPFSDSLQPAPETPLSSSGSILAEGNRSALMVAATGLGKAQPLTETVLTPMGWVPIGTIKVGDQVIGSDGQPKSVTGVFPQGMLPTLSVHFSDKTVVKCCHEHLWSVQTKHQKHRGSGYTTKTCGELLGDVRDGGGNAKWFLPLIDPVQFDPVDLPVHPYAIGAMLGDGGYKYGMNFSSSDDFVLQALGDSLPDEYEISHIGNYDYTIKVGRNTRFGVGSVLRQVLGRHGADTKRIPCDYMRGTPGERLSLLHGLMDTDGTASKDGHCEFNTVSPCLAVDVRDLIRSLGGVTRIRTKPPGTYTHKGEERTGRPSYRITVSIGESPFLLPRKAVRALHDPKYGRTKSITDIRETGDSEHCVCISIDSEDSLYVTSGYNLTHNTVEMAALAEHWPIGRVMMIAHRFELNRQAQKTFQTLCHEPVDFEQADFKADQCSSGDKCRIVVASVQSLNSKSNKTGQYRFEKFDPNEFGLLLIDEAHRSVAASYRRVIDYFQNANSDCFLVGVTATPDRLDGVGLGHVFEAVACDHNIRWGIDEGWLVPIKQKFVSVQGLDFSSIKSKKNEVGESDLDRLQLANIVEQESVLHEMATPIIELAGEKQAIVFCVSVDQCHRLAEIFNRHKPGCAIALDGSMPPMHPDRQQAMKDFRGGTFQFLINVNIATEGFDCPNVAVIAMCRPTKSRALYTQCVGRGTRVLPEAGIDAKATTSDERMEMIAGSLKPSCTVLDFVGQASRHSLVCTADILAGENDPTEIVDAAKRKVAEKDYDGDMVQAMHAARKEMEEREAQRRAKITARVDYTTYDVDVWTPAGWIPPRTVRGFEGSQPPSVKQKAALEKFGFSRDEVATMNHRQANAMMTKCIERVRSGLCSIKQRKLLSKYGVNAVDLTFAQASTEISKIANNGWKRL